MGLAAFGVTPYQEFPAGLLRTLPSLCTRACSTDIAVCLWVQEAPKTTEIVKLSSAGCQSLRIA